MQVRRNRVIILALVLMIGIGAGLLAWDVQRRVGELGLAARDIDARIDRMLATTADMVAAQQAYVAPGQPESPWLARFSSLVQQLGDDVAAARLRAHSGEAAAALNAISEGIGTLVQLDGRVREHLSAGQDLIAADLIFADSRLAVDAMTGHLRTTRDAERAAFGGAQEAATRQGWIVLGAGALLWLAGLVLLARTHDAPAAAAAAATRPRQADAMAEEQRPPLDPPLAVPLDISLDVLPGAPRDARPGTGRTPVDLATAADVCTAISRMTTSVELPDLLARAAAVLDAAGIIVWMSADEELFAVTAHGYDARVISRLGRIGRNADNATAACWRTGELKTFAGDVISNGAVVAPMFGPDTCIGALAAEVRHGREAETDTRAVTAMIAAQLATVVAAWPAASGAATASGISPAAATGS